MTYVATWPITPEQWPRLRLWWMEAADHWNSTPLWNLPPGSVQLRHLDYAVQYGKDGRQQGVTAKAFFRAIEDDALLGIYPGRDLSTVIPEGATWTRDEGL